MVAAGGPSSTPSLGGWLLPRQLLFSIVPSLPAPRSCWIFVVNKCTLLLLCPPIIFIPFQSWSALLSEATEASFDILAFLSAGEWWQWWQRGQSSLLRGASKAEMRKKRTKPQTRATGEEREKHCNLLVTQCKRGKGRRRLMSWLTLVF